LHVSRDQSRPVSSVSSHPSMNPRPGGRTRQVVDEVFWQESS
jgi:hypothetical protein